MTTSQTSNAKSMTQSDVRWITSSLRRAVSLGLAAGLGEAAVLLTWRYFGGRMQIHTDLDILWMAPLADAVVFVVVALGLCVMFALVGRRASGISKVALVTGALVALAVWSLTQRVPQIGGRSGAILGLGAGVAIAGVLRRRQRTRTIIDRAAFPLGGLVVALAGGLIVTNLLRERRALAALPAADSGAPNVLLLILDTVRAQSTSLYGYARPTTPVLAALADSGVRFTNAFSTAPWTLPSHASIFTGRYPHELSADWLTPLDLADQTLAERFRSAGYVTGGFVGNYMISREVGVARGFMHYEDYLHNVKQLAMSSALTSWLLHKPRLRRTLKWYDHVNRKTADDVNAAALRWIRARGKRPYFAFLNYLDAHEFYLPPKPYATMFGPDTARKNWHIGFSMRNGGIAYRTDKAVMKPYEIQSELNAHEAALAYIDARIGALLQSLARDDAGLRNTIVVVTSDHGEHFGEHGKFEHGMSLYPQLLHVPLVLYAPGRLPKGIRVEDATTLRDLAATIEKLALGTSKLPGTSLSAYWDADSSSRSTSAVQASRTISTRVDAPEGARVGAWAVVVDGKLVMEFVGGPPVTEVYDLRTDPLGSSNVADSPSVQAAIDSARRLYRGLQWKSRAPSTHLPPR